MYTNHTNIHTKCTCILYTHTYPQMEVTEYFYKNRYTLIKIKWKFQNMKEKMERD